MISSAAEVVAVCGFVFGVACKLPPSLTILLLNGVFWVVIARHFFWDIVRSRYNHQRTSTYNQLHDIGEDLDSRNNRRNNHEGVRCQDGYEPLLNSRNINQRVGNRNIDDRSCRSCKHRLVPLLKFVALLIQLSVLITVPIILIHTEHLYNGRKTQNIILCFLIPVTLTLMSIAWLGWLQKYFVKPRGTVTSDSYTARLKSGEY